MPRHPVADNGGKLSDLKTDARIIQRRVTEKIFVEANLRALIRGIEMPIDAHLTKEIKMVRPLHVGEDRQSRVEEKSVVRFDQSGRALVDEVTFKVDQPAQLQLKLVFRVADGERVVHPIKKIGARFEREPEDNSGTEDVDLTSHELTC